MRWSLAAGGDARGEFEACRASLIGRWRSHPSACEPDSPERRATGRSRKVCAAGKPEYEGQGNRDPLDSSVSNRRCRMMTDPPHF